MYAIRSYYEVDFKTGELTKVKNAPPQGEALVIMEIS